MLKAAIELMRGLVFGGSILLLSYATPVSAINGFAYDFRATMTPSGVDPNARGTIRGHLLRRGTADNQLLTITVSKLDTNTTYHLVAFREGSVTATPVADFTTGPRGGASILYVKHQRAQHLPAALDPISDVWELDIVNGTGNTVLQADLTDPDSFSYSDRRALDNTGFVRGAGGVLWLSGTPRATRASAVATGLTPFTEYQLLVNGVGVRTKTSDSMGNLAIAGPRFGLELVLDIRTVALADSTGTNIILISTGLGIPGALSGAGQAPVVLGAVADFAVLAGSTVTSTGGTTINGDLGLAPGSAITIAPPGKVTGTIHDGDTAAGLAAAALTLAYNDAKGRTMAHVRIAGDLGGQTLAPGLYRSTSSLEVSSGDLTLDAQGDVNAVFIFQIASTLSTTDGRKVILSGGARAGNIFWQVGSSATLGTTSTFKGTIMADQSITLDTGARLDGRALARIGAVTMDSNTITLPMP